MANSRGVRLSGLPDSITPGAELPGEGFFVAHRPRPAGGFPLWHHILAKLPPKGVCNPRDVLGAQHVLAKTLFGRRQACHAYVQKRHPDNIARVRCDEGGIQEDLGVEFDRVEYAGPSFWGGSVVRVPVHEIWGVWLIWGRKQNVLRPTKPRYDLVVTLATRI